VALYVPSAHDSQAVSLVDPRSTLNLPTAHGVQLVTPMAPSWYVPAGHREHTDAPESASRYEPAPHAAHTFDCAPTTALNEPNGHGSHADTSVALVCVLNVPAGQRAHSLTPLVAAL
jgi:hypothetical protein